MKKLNIFLFTFIFLGFYLISCDQEVDVPQPEAYSPPSIDVFGGNWKTYILSGANEISVPVPQLESTSQYKSELAALKIKNQDLSQTEKDAIKFWGVGAVYRWNEIARELAAKYNIPPASNAEGKYPAPDPANPLADPKFPFANPPYTSRALAYLSVAQYDALVSTWHYKFKYNRKSAFKNDNTISNLLPETNLPSYPSEEAVVAAASFAVLSAMFPGEVPFLEQKMAESKMIGFWAGKNVESDVKAGENLGKSVAEKVLNKAKGDGMSAANNQSLTNGMIENARKLGFKTVWDSQEIPKRPAMLPNFGSVKTWNFDNATLIKIRPKIPYLENSAEFNKEIDELKSIQKNQTREQARIANFWADGPSTYTPPGHWHRYAANEAINAKFSEIRMARTLALVGTALMDAGIACWDTKYYYYSPRPQQFGIKTSVGLPNFPSYSSGHSTFSAAAATVLSYVFPDKAQQFNKYAIEASDSRVYGLIHFRVDCVMGLQHGKVIGDYAIARGKADGSQL